MQRRFVNYFRVSCESQGIQGNGIQAQEFLIKQFLRPDDVVIAEFREVESGGNSQREELRKAIQLTKKEKATLLVSNLTRLSRSASLIFHLRESGVRFMAADNEFADEFTINLLAILSEREKKIIGQRTRDGLAAARRRGVRLGNPNPKEALTKALAAIGVRADAYAASLLPAVREIQGTGVKTLQGLATCLNIRGFKSPRGFAFTPQTVKSLLARGQVKASAGG